ncbi:MAG: PQQ-dependent sugar dehydrogenase, partial [Acidimicrobiia bacterium]|nr:PQQ-dependent sugar dehydrogenase [Acidimicrobiia bacterium]
AWYAGFVNRIHELGVTAGCSTSPFRYCPLGAVTRAEMASFLARSFGLALEQPPARPSVQGLALGLQTVATGLASPIFVDAPAGDSRLFIVERSGRIKILANGSMAAQPFLDISGLVGSGGEGGLLGMAFHPGFAANGRFFVSYTDKGGDSRVVEYAVSANPNLADAGSARPLLFVDQPASNHNGGMIAFGPDGKLYVGLGDGGGGGDTYGHGQRPDTLLATITRLDVDSGATSLFAYGLRNPWRFSIDGQRFYIGDVGQSAREEVDVISTFQSGANLGWSIMEGSVCFGASSCNKLGLALPVLEYTHAEGCSITGGVVYRGAAIPELSGHYLYGDFCTGFVRSFRYTGGVADTRQWPFTVSRLVSFGVDGSGEVYVISLDGTVSRIVRG